MRKFIVAASVAIIASLSGCAAKQEISKFSGEMPSSLCIAKHQQVKEGVLDALVQGFANHNIKTKVIDGRYVDKHGVLEPQVDKEKLQGCDGIVFYTARWNWDLALYMSYANIWVTDPLMDGRVAQATYISRHGLDKFINAKKKIIELVDSMIATS